LYVCEISGSGAVLRLRAETIKGWLVGQYVSMTVFVDRLEPDADHGAIPAGPHPYLDRPANRQDRPTTAPATLPVETATPKTDTPKRRFAVYRDALKYGLDVTIVLGAAVVVLPVVLLMALFVSRDGHSPFYSQTRIGKNGRIFRMWKMRTMVPNAKKQLDSYLATNPAAKAEWDSTQKLKNDPRITPIGRILRKTSLDELPQLWNVLVGDMSIVGPRPMMEDQKDLYPGQAYYRMRPGITGLWQISDRNECSFAGRAKFDDMYERDLTLLSDVTILLRTVGVVLRGTGY